MKIYQKFTKNRFFNKTKKSWSYSYNMHRVDFSLSFIFYLWVASKYYRINKSIFQERTLPKNSDQYDYRKWVQRIKLQVRKIRSGRIISKKKDKNIKTRNVSWDELYFKISFSEYCIMKCIIFFYSTDI